MKKLERAVYPPEQLQSTYDEMVTLWAAGDPMLQKHFPTHDPKLAAHMIGKFLQEHYGDEQVWKNDVYQVAVRHPGEGLVHLSIKRLDKRPVTDWRDKQQIKNQLCGPECEGVELYPAESRLVDTSNQFHVWVVTKPGFKFPFGFDEGRLISDVPLSNGSQRPFEKENKS